MVIRHERAIKICQVATVDLSLRFLLFGFMKHLKRSGFEVWGASSRGRWIQDIKESGLSVKTIEMKRELFSPLHDLVALWHLIFFFRRERFDIVHTHTPKASFLGQIAAFIAGVPIRVHTVHGLFFLADSSWRRKGFFMLIEKITAFFSHVVFFVSREDMKTVEETKDYPKEKIRYFGGGVDLERFNPARFSKHFIAEKKKGLGVPPDAKVIGIVARLVVEKGYFDLFRAFQTVLATFPEAFLLAVGPSEPNKRDGFSQSIVKRFGIEERVLFLGERVDVEELYAVMDIFVLPSYREGLGLSILEASAMGKPIVATNIRGCREAVDDGKTGKLVPPRSPAELAEALMYFLSHKKEAETMGEVGAEKVQKEFNEQLAFDRITKEYQRLIEEKLR